MLSLITLIWGCFWSINLATTFSAGVIGDYPIMFASAIKSVIVAYILEKLAG